MELKGWLSTNGNENGFKFMYYFSEYLSVMPIQPKMRFECKEPDIIMSIHLSCYKALIIAGNSAMDALTRTIDLILKEGAFSKEDILESIDYANKYWSDTGIWMVSQKVMI